MIDIKDIKPGDTVVLEHEDGTRLAPCEVRPGGQSFQPGLWISPPHVLAPLGWSLSVMLGSCWTITDHKPKVVLPTEPGWYMRAQDSFGDTDTTLYALSGDGEWTTDGSLRWKPIDPTRLPRDLVRLVPEGFEREQAIREAIEWASNNILVSADGSRILKDAFDRIATHYGVTL